MKCPALIGVLLLLASAGAQGKVSAADRKQVNDLAAQYKAAKTAYQKSPANPQVRKRVIVAGDRAATVIMTSEALPPRTRYPVALGIYQFVLSVDPANREAMNNARMIDSVYKGMIARSKAQLAKNPKDKGAADTLARLTGVYRSIHRPLP